MVLWEVWSLFQIGSSEKSIYVIGTNSATCLTSRPCYAFNCASFNARLYFDPELSSTPSSGILRRVLFVLTFLALELFFLILAHPVYKM